MDAAASTSVSAAVYASTILGGISSDSFRSL